MALLSATAPAITGVATTIATAAVLFALSWVWRQLKKQLTEGHEENKKTLAAILLQAQQTNGQVVEQGKAIGFLRERTAGLESAVFHRPPITQEDTASLGI